MLKSGMSGTWIYYRCQPELMNSVKALKQRMLYYVVEQSAWYFYKSENRIVDDL